MNWGWNLFVLLNASAGHSALLDKASIFLVEDAFLLFGGLLIALWPILGRTRWWWIGLSLAIGVSRVPVGVLYTSDVIGGFVPGAAWGMAARWAAPYLAR